MADVKLTPIGRLLNSDHPSPPIRLPFPAGKLDDPTFIPRLSFRHTPRLPTNYHDLADALALHCDHALFIDTNMADADREWWEALLSEPRRVYLTARVARELLPYLKRHPDHPLRAAIADHNPAIVFRPDPEEDAPGRVAFDYYLYLLTRRRIELAARIERFKTENGRDPSPVEVETIKMAFQRFAGERLMRLNNKPISPRQTDEALIVHAFAHAVKTGQRTKIISGDFDVEDQFHTMTRLLTDHYYAMLVGRLYAADWAALRPTAVPAPLLAKYEPLFEQHGAALIDLGERGIHDLIPPYSPFVPVSISMITAAYTSEVTYGADTAMADVFTTKDATGGLSTDCLGGRNVHARLLPEDFGRLIPGAALVAFDKGYVVPGTRARVAHFDVMSTYWPGDPHALVERVEVGDGASTRRRLIVPNWN